MLLSDNFSYFFDRTIMSDTKDKPAALYTFMSPPHTVPVRAPDYSRQLDPSKLQVNLCNLRLLSALNRNTVKMKIMNFKTFKMK